MKYLMEINRLGLPLQYPALKIMQPDVKSLRTRPRSVVDVQGIACTRIPSKLTHTLQLTKIKNKC